MMLAHRFRWSIAMAVFTAGCCSEGAPADPTAASSTAPASDGDVPHRKLLGTWRYDEPTKEQLSAFERRSRSIHERDRLTRAARELTRVTKTYTKDRRTTDVGGGKPIEHRYEVLELSEQSITVRLTPVGPGNPFEETLKFSGDGKMVEVVDGVPRGLTRM